MRVGFSVYDCVRLADPPERTSGYVVYVSDDGATVRVIWAQRLDLCARITIENASELEHLGPATGTIAAGASARLRLTHRGRNLWLARWHSSRTSPA